MAPTTTTSRSESRTSRAVDTRHAPASPIRRARRLPALGPFAVQPLRVRPAPSDAEDGPDAWVPDFLVWLAGPSGDVRRRTVGRMVLRCWNGLIEVDRATDLEIAYLGMDDANRRGVRTLLEHYRTY